jgi:glycerol-3-phosphate acyltransferase PlsX
LRHKKKSSMRVAIEQVRDGAAQAAVSAGNTGALMAIARYVLKTMNGIDRPAIASQLPNQKGGATTVLDLGANIDCQPDHLVQFAIMGAAFTAAINGGRAPLVGLLNVGEEAMKGGDILRQTGDRLRHMSAQGHIQFHGNVEGNDIFKGTVDVVVCDGFVGNVALKASEGVASMMGGMIREEFSRSPWRKLAGLVAYPVLKAFKMRVDHRRYNGAALLGLRGLVFKSHGSADDVAFEHALNRAYAAVQGDLLRLVHTQIETLSMTAHANQPVAEL